MIDEKYRKLDPYRDLKNKVMKELAKSPGDSENTEKTFEKKKNLEDYKDPHPHDSMPLAKLQKKFNFEVGQKNYFGVENMKNIVNHEYEKEFIKAKAQKEEDQILNLLKKEDNLRGMDTKASVMRNKAIKEQIQKHQNQENSPFR